MVKVEIDEGSGFCFGVVTAIRKAEEELANGGTLYCLGDIVHNSREVERLENMGLTTINHEEFRQLKNAKVLLRAHGEPPETYEIARRNNIEIIDATCPVVLQLQKRIKQEFMAEESSDKQIVIYGKNGHAEVLGLVGQTNGYCRIYQGTHLPRCFFRILRYNLPPGSQPHPQHPEICLFARSDIFRQRQEKFERENALCRMPESQPKFTSDRQRG